ncbi:MAG TPA: glycosyltransferase family 2 protein [Polyangiaceae bacterium]|nr:glycosyltransferase family 2 protein [Polyangiaceae bacterium]
MADVEPNPGARVALVLTVRNERKLLRQNLCYHHHLGAEKAYVYLDDCTDGTDSTVRDLPFVELRNSRTAEQHADDAEAADYRSQLGNIVTARQCLNALDAVRAARSAGIDWICHLDADELLCVQSHRLEAGVLAKFFAGLPRSVDAVRFRSYATCRELLRCPDRFADIQLFTTPYTFVKRRLEWPDGPGHFEHSLLMGHRLGKMAARVHADTVPDGVHRFRRQATGQRTFSFPVGLDGFTKQALRQPGNLLAVLHPRPRLLHYYLVDVDDFANKFRRHKQHPNQYMNGRQIEDVFRRWRDFANAPTTTDEQLFSYYERNVLDRFSAAERRWLLASRQLARITGPSRFFHEVYATRYGVAPAHESART